jgi:hypothetical protein
LWSREEEKGDSGFEAGSDETAIPEPLRRKPEELQAKSPGGRGMDATERLIRKSRHYEVLAASHEERAGVDHRVEYLMAATGFVIAAIVLREVALALAEREDWRG